MSRPRLAVVGAGISGLTAAYLLRQTYHVTVFEREERLGGDAHTHEVPLDGQTAFVDSGFIVLNDRTYPLLRRLFDELGVTIRPTEMSMGISCEGCGLAYVGGRGVRGIFAQRRRLFDPTFWRLLLSVRRFQRAASALLTDDSTSSLTYGDFLAANRFSQHFVEHYALPIVACVWSSGRRDALDYPAAYLFAFLAHHGFLDLGDAPEWYVVEGGSRAYVEAIRSRLSDVLTDDAVVSVERLDDGVTVTDAAGKGRRFDKIVLATHADEALALLADATREEKEVLGAFGYSTNVTQLHRDDTVLPRRTAERASWNFHLDDCHQDTEHVQVSYWMNRLQHHPAAHPLVVTLNGTERVERGAVIATMDYTHPTYTLGSVAAQRRLDELNTAQTTFA
ncbi:MAG: FAD-dependent oxidoreductase, partial [Nocardioidaceae bacterium]